MKKQKFSPAMLEGIDKGRKSLFDTIVDNENLQIKEMECQRIANRVGVIKKILVNRNLTSLDLEFDQRLQELIKEFATRIDNGLYPSEEDCESKV